MQHLNPSGYKPNLAINRNKQQQAKGFIINELAPLGGKAFMLV